MVRGKFLINGEEKEFEFPGHYTLLRLLRENGYTEVKAGCEEGYCGSCLVLLDGKPVNSCQVFAASAIGHDIKTVKGLEQKLRDLIIDSLVEAGAVQCGFCSPGFIVAIYSLLKENPEPEEEEIKEAIDGNLCRCTGYVKIVEGVKIAVERLKRGAMKNGK